MLDAEPGMRAMLTRDDDYFVPLAARVQKARRVQADLFVSIHADAFREPTARGSSVFALSESGATSAAASGSRRRRTRRTSSAASTSTRRDRVLARTLLDLSQTAQINDSLKVGRHMLDELGTHNALHKTAVEQAGFAVLKAPDIPSILVETAFISNPDEEPKLRSDRHQARFAESIGDGVSPLLRGESAARAQRGAARRRVGDHCAARSHNPRDARFFVLFVALQAVLFGLELTPWAQAAFRRAVDQHAGRDLRLARHAVRSERIAVGKVMRSTANGFAVSIEAGLQRRRGHDRAARGDPRVPRAVEAQARGLAAGVVAVQGLNVVRVISLFYLGQWNREVFEWAHLYVWQALIMLDVLVVWLIWVRTLPRADAGSPPAARRRAAVPASAHARHTARRGAARSPRFIVRMLAWLPVAFVVWYFAAPVLLWPALGSREGVARLGFADLVRAVEQHGGDAGRS